MIQGNEYGAESGCREKPVKMGWGLLYIESLGSKLIAGTCEALSSRRSLEEGGDDLGDGSGCHMAMRAGPAHKLVRSTPSATMGSREEIQSQPGFFS